MFFASPIAPINSSFTTSTFPSLKSLWIRASPLGSSSARTFFEDVANFQADSGAPIEFIYLAFGDYNEGFEIAKGEVYSERPPSASFREAWNGARVQELEIEWYYPGDDAGAYLNIGVSSRFLAGTILSPSRLRTFAESYEFTYHFTFAAERCDLRWSDWDQTLQLIPTCLPILGVLDLSCSVTPLPTVSTTLACSSNCYNNLSLSHPSLHRDAELVGGFVSVWNASVALNLNRLKELGPRFDRRGDRKVDWWMISPDGWMVNMVGIFGRDGRLESWEDKLGSTPSEERISHCYCFGCGEVKEGEDPITALRACGVKEVRDALAAGGFDLNEFDASTPTSPIDQDSFETFLRSAT
ncbi:hypothetical protein BDY24DRAFT_91283 [Mrakia frigida]|uniref:uncharacterized protein n=1 Tax=Mrakia frigida TaxID=29902 RepID=UPI003FCC03C9